MMNRKGKVGNAFCHLYLIILSLIAFSVSVDTVVFGEGIGRIDIQSYQILTETFYLR